MNTKEFYITYKVKDEELVVPITCRSDIYEKIDYNLTNHIESPIDNLMKGLIEYHAVLLGLDPDNGLGRIYFPDDNLN